MSFELKGSGRAILPIGCLLLASAAMGQEADPCAGLKTAVTLGTIDVNGTAVTTQGTWTAAPGTPGVMVEVRTDSDRKVSYTLLGAQGEWHWVEPDYHVSVGLCQPHVLRVLTYPLVREGEGFFHCLDNATSAKNEFKIECGLKAAIASCEWSCAADAAGVRLCHGKCTGSASGLGDAFVPQWSVGATVLDTASAAPVGPWVQELDCRPGQKIELTVRLARGPRKPSPPATAICGES